MPRTKPTDFTASLHVREWTRPRVRTGQAKSRQRLRVGEPSREDVTDDDKAPLAVALSNLAPLDLHRPATQVARYCFPAVATGVALLQPQPQRVRIARALQLQVLTGN